MRCPIPTWLVRDPYLLHSHQGQSEDKIPLTLVADGIVSAHRP